MGQIKLKALVIKFDLTQFIIGVSSISFLKKFTKSELMFDDKETIIILKFIFKNQSVSIDSLVISALVREFEQGLLVEAVDIVTYQPSADAYCI